MADTARMPQMGALQKVPEYRKRPDGTMKGPGFLGPLTHSSGKTATELSIGVNVNGKEMLIPSIVPTLDKNEINYLLGGGKPTKGIIDKAVQHALERQKGGLSPFKEWDEQP